MKTYVACILVLLLVPAIPPAAAQVEPTAEGDGFLAAVRTVGSRLGSSSVNQDTPPLVLDEQPGDGTFQLHVLALRKDADGEWPLGNMATETPFDIPEVRVTLIPGRGGPSGPTWEPSPDDAVFIVELATGMSQDGVVPDGMVVVDAADLPQADYGFRVVVEEVDTEDPRRSEHSLPKDAFFWRRPTTTSNPDNEQMTTLNALGGGNTYSLLDDLEARQAAAPFTPIFLQSQLDDAAANIADDVAGWAQDPGPFLGGAPDPTAVLGCGGADAQENLTAYAVQGGCSVPGPGDDLVGDPGASDPTAVLGCGGADAQENTTTFLLVGGCDVEGPADLLDELPDPGDLVGAGVDTDPPQVQDTTDAGQAAQTGGAFVFSATATDEGSGVGSVVARVTTTHADGTTDDTPQDVPMGHAGEDAYEGTLSVPDTAVSFEYAINATDNAALANTAQTETVTVAVVDTLPPQVGSFDTEPGGPVLAGGFDLVVQPSDNIGVDAVEVVADGQAFPAADDGSGWRATVAAGDLPDGTHTFTATATDAAGNQATATLDRTVDTSPPSVSLLLDGTAGQGGWHVSDVTVTVDAVEPHSSITDIEIDVDGQTESLDVADPSRTFDVDGQYEIRGRATNSAGLEAETPAATLRVDTVPPATQVGLELAGGGAYTPGDVAVEEVEATLAPDDDTSGVANTRYRLYQEGGQPPAGWTQYDAPFTVGDGRWVLEVSSTDAAGNEEAPQPSTVRVDVEGPTASAQADPAPQATGWIHAAAADVTLVFEDATTGVAVEKYSLSPPADAQDPGEYDAYDGPFQVTGEGVHTIHYYAEDGSGNVGTGSLDVRLDGTAPTSSHVITPGDDRATIEITAADGASGVEAIEYRLLSSGSDPPFQDYGGVFDVTETGAYILEHRAVDAAGHVEAAQQSPEFTVGQVGPGVDVGLSGTPGSPGWFLSPVEATVTLSAPEGGSIQSRQCLLDDSPVDCSADVSTHDVDGAGGHTLAVTATGQDGRTTEVVRDFSIDLTDPVVEYVSGPPADGSWSPAGEAVFRARAGGAAAVGTLEVCMRAGDGSPPACHPPASPAPGDDGLDLGVPLPDGAWLVEATATAESGRTDAVDEFQVRVDATAPALHVSGLPDAWTTQSPVHLEIQASDETSGLSGGPRYKLWPDGTDEPADPTPYTGALEVGEGAWNLRVLATDEAGNGNDTGAVPFGVDTTPPAVTGDLSDGEAHTGGAFTFRITAADATSGVAAVEVFHQFSSDGSGPDARMALGGSGGTFSGLLDVPSDEDVPLHYWVRVTDAAGNTHDAPKQEVPVRDSVAPQVDMVATAVRKEGHAVGEVTLTATATDNVGVADVSFLLDGTPLDAQPVVDGDAWRLRLTPPGEGARSFSVSVLDAAGNEAGDTVQIDVDNRPPVTTATAPEGWVRIPADARVALSAADSASGVGATEFKLWCGGQDEPVSYQDYTAPVAVEAEGVCRVKYRSVDAAGNREQPQEVEVRLDTQVPDVVLAGQAPTAGMPGQAVTVRASASDALSGLDRVVLVAGGAETEMAVGDGHYRADLTPPADADSVAYLVRAYDGAGNAAQTDPVTLDIDHGAAVAQWTSRVASSLRVTTAGGGGGLVATLTWDPVEHATGYQVWRADSPFTLVSEVDGGQASYTDHGAGEGSVYVVTAYLTVGGVDHGRAADPGDIEGFAELGRVSAYARGAWVDGPGGDGVPSVFLSNSGQEPITYTLEVRILDGDGDLVRNKMVSITVEPGGSRTVDLNEAGLLAGAAAYEITASNGTTSQSLHTAELDASGGGRSLVGTLLWIALVALLGGVAVLSYRFASSRRRGRGSST